MNTPIFLALPHIASHEAARALVMALGLNPEPMKDGKQALSMLQAQMQQHPSAVALLACLLK